MERIRKPLQGVWNIIRFNWHFFVLSALAILLLWVAANFIGNDYKAYVHLIIAAVVAAIIVSLTVSFYVYDISNLYTLNWLAKAGIHPTGKLINIHAGFDETSIILQTKYPAAEITVLDFYNPQTHTEVSIARARKAYPSFAGTLSVSTAKIPLANVSVDVVLLILAAHEIRDEQERILFFKELKRVLKPDEKMVVTEHLRDVPNFLAYNIGAFHFHSKTAWYRTFQQAGLHVHNQIKITPFITTFILEKNGTAS